MNYVQRVKNNGVKLELTWYKARNCWRKKHNHKAHYFHHPITQAGYEAALHEWALLKTRLDCDRPNADVWHHHRELFVQVQTYWQQFGLPTTEITLSRQVDAFLEWIEGYLEQYELPQTMPVGNFTTRNKQFGSEFVGRPYTSFGTIQYDLPDKWIDRIDRLTAKTYRKEPQTIRYWLDKYLERVKSRGDRYITQKTANDRDFKLRHFRRYLDLEAHITTIDDAFCERYHDALDATVSHATGMELSKASKREYWKGFSMFVCWASMQTSCELTLPATLKSNEHGFREANGTGRKRQQKRSLLWTVEDFTNAMDNLPLPYSCFILLMLNCGFRHVDLSELKHDDVDLDAGRIVIQRNKLNQQETAPVVSYKLWDKSIELLKQTKSDHPEFVFLNSAQLQVENSIKVWWKRNKAKYGGKRLDYIRKTGSTIIAQHDRNLDELYLGESLSTTARISYSFNDGEPCKALDDAIATLGATFSLCEPPVKMLAVDDKMLAALKSAGFDV